MDGAAHSSCPASATIISYQFLRQLLMEHLQGVLSVLVKLSEEDRSVGERHTYQKIEKVLVELSTFHFGSVIAPHLVTQVHSSHEPVVVGSGGRTGKRCSGSVLLGSKNSGVLLWIVSSIHHRNKLPVHPCRGTNIVSLYGEYFTSV